MAPPEVRQLSERWCSLLLSQIDAGAGSCVAGAQVVDRLLAKPLEIGGMEVGLLSRTTTPLEHAALAPIIVLLALALIEC